MIIDLYDRNIVAYVINDNNLIFRTYELAISKNPDVTPILHSGASSIQAKLNEANMSDQMYRQ